MPEYSMKDMSRQRAATYQQIYANLADMSESFFDVTITFSQVKSGERGTVPIIEDNITVAMSWEHAKAMCKVLMDRIEKYEAVNGKLRMQRNEAKQPSDGPTS